MTEKARHSYARSFPKIYQKIYERKIRAENPLVGVTPISNGKEGYSSYFFTTSYIPFPSPKEVDQIGGDLLGVSMEFLNIMVGRGGLKKNRSYIRCWLWSWKNSLFISFLFRSSDSL